MPRTKSRHSTQDISILNEDHHHSHHNEEEIKFYTEVGIVLYKLRFSIRFPRGAKGHGEEDEDDEDGGEEEKCLMDGVPTKDFEFRRCTPPLGTSTPVMDNRRPSRPPPPIPPPSYSRKVRRCSYV
ncbi:unnamed protein product [Lepeophtheirus salmonis]|uniref:(salmon louse) hypothetical protein n=1 Tax=Lepeophtheirus salmonis TaxID=72036 RepID=A0A0K2T1D8_LEPSM|nr:unnamed protein product [Lepeophtheirus salmonis]CAF3014021.1 unnamed protein product [Lepeophtheirus salmonis]